MGTVNIILVITYFAICTIAVSSLVYWAIIEGNFLENLRFKRLLRQLKGDQQGNGSSDPGDTLNGDGAIIVNRCFCDALPKIEVTYSNVQVRCDACGVRGPCIKGSHKTHDLQTELAVLSWNKMVSNSARALATQSKIDLIKEGY